jgi:hypothetical protein
MRFISIQIGFEATIWVHAQPAVVTLSDFGRQVTVFGRSIKRYCCPATEAGVS